MKICLLILLAIASNYGQAEHLNTSSPPNVSYLSDTLLQNTDLPDLGEVVNHPVLIKYKKYSDDTYIQYCNLLDAFLLEGVKMTSLIINVTKFNNSVKLVYSTLDKLTITSTDFHLVEDNSGDQYNTVAKSNVEISRNIFRDKVGFLETNFYSSTKFSFNTFNDTTKFQVCKFHEDLSISYEKFIKSAFFTSSHFLSDAHFEESLFKEDLSFENSSFLMAPTFNGTQFGDKLIFISTDLSNLKQDIYLNAGRIDSLRAATKDYSTKCKLYLYHTNVERFIVDHNIFELAFRDEVAREDRISIFQQVIKKCMEVGLDESAREFDIDLQKFRLTSDEGFTGFVSPVLIWFQEYWWGFGYEKSKILRNTLTNFLLSLIVIYIFFKRISSVYFPAEQLGLTSKQATSLIFARSGSATSITRFKISLFYTALVFFGWKMDHSKVNYREYPWTTLLIYAIYVVGLIHLAYLAAFVIAR